MPNFTEFKGASDIGTPEFTEILKANIITFCEWGFLQTGAYYNVEVPASGTYGGDMHKLRPVSDPRYTDGQVWEAFRKNWVWESGITQQSTQPIAISGVFVDNVFTPINSGYHINYPEGKIVFDTAQSVGSEVKLAYSFKYVNIIDSRNVSWFREGQPRSMRLDNDNFLLGSGLYNHLSETRIQLPAVILEGPISRTKSGYEIGSKSQWSSTDMVLHVVGESDTEVNRISDILDRQEEKTIYMFDTDRMADEDRFPLDHNGSLNPSGLTYPDLVAATGDGGYKYTRGTVGGKVTIIETDNQNGNWISHNVYHQTVKWTTQVILKH